MLIWGQFCKRYLNHQSLKFAWKLRIKFLVQISPGASELKHSQEKELALHKSQNIHCLFEHFSFTDKGGVVPKHMDRHRPGGSSRPGRGPPPRMGAMSSMGLGVGPTKAAKDPLKVQGQKSNIKLTLISKVSGREVAEWNSQSMK